MQNVLITGGCGFIGTNLVKYLSVKGFACKILDNLLTSAGVWQTNNKWPDLTSCSVSEMQRIRVNLENKPIDVDIIAGDVRGEDAVKFAIRDVKYVVHLAACGNVADSVASPKQSWDVNVNGTINLLEACRVTNVNKFIFASSNAAVGEQQPPIDELKLTRPISPYGAAKATGEALCHAYFRSFGLNTVSLRFANCYGHFSEHKTSVIRAYFDQLRKGEPLIIYGDGSQTRDFIHVHDICQAIYKSLISDKSSGEIIQIASGKETSINELVAMLREITSEKIQVTYKSGRTGDIKRSYSDIAKAERLLGFKPEVNLEDGLRNLWDGIYF